MLTMDSRRTPIHVTPTLEDIIPKMSGVKYFSTLDANCGYWNVRLDEQSSSLTTFNSPYVRYRFKRMPFGLKMSHMASNLRHLAGYLHLRDVSTLSRTGDGR